VYVHALEIHNSLASLKDIIPLQKGVKKQKIKRQIVLKPRLFLKEFHT
jgi:hypothetical protein